MPSCFYNDPCILLQTPLQRMGRHIPCPHIPAQLVYRGQLSQLWYMGPGTKWDIIYQVTWYRKFVPLVYMGHLLMSQGQFYTTLGTILYHMWMTKLYEKILYSGIIYPN